MTAAKRLLLLGTGFALILGVVLLRPRKPESPPKISALVEAPKDATPAENPHVEGAQAAPVETRIQGFVIDGLSKNPIAGAKLAFHRPRPARPGERLDLSLRAHYRMERSVGTVGSFIKYGQPDRAYDRPEEGVPPLAATEADASGEFQISVPMPNVIVECGHPEYMTLFGPFWIESIRDRKITIHLYPGTLVRGRVVRVGGEPVRHKLRIALFGQDQRNWIGGGVWEMTTNAQGAFEVEVGAPKIFPKIQELGWRILSPEEPVDVAFGMTMEITARRSPLLIVTDAETGAPLERFSVLLGRDKSTLGHWMRGEMTVPGGIYPLLYDSIDENAYRGAFKLQVWAEGRAEFERDIPDLLVSDDIEAALARGSAPTVSGLVQRKGVGVKGARLSLNVGFQDSNGWKPESLTAVSTAASGAGGEFSLGAPAGTYVLLVRHESLVHAVAIQIPCASLVIDLGEQAEVHVRARDPGGVALGGVVVLLQTEHNRRWHETTDAQGVARFKSIPPGIVWIAPGAVYNPGSNQYTNNTSRWIQFRVVVGQTNVADLTVEAKPTPQPLATRFSVRGITSLEGWKITDMSNSETLAPNDSGQLIVSSRTSGLRVESPWGDTWWLRAPKDAGAAWTVELDPQGIGYDGILTDLASGRPVTNASVQATGEPSLLSKSDANGRFRLRGLGTGDYKLSFNLKDHYSAALEPSAKPSSNPSEMRVALPRKIDQQSIEGFPNRRISGRLLNSATSEPCANATIFSYALVKTAEGTLVLGVQGSTTHSDADGHYLLVLPSTSSYRAHFVVRRGPEHDTYPREWTMTGGGDAVMDFKFP